jgi:hypothetical protein
LTSSCWVCRRIGCLKILSTLDDLKRNVTKDIAAISPANVGSNFRDHGASCRPVPPGGKKQISASSASQLCPYSASIVCTGKLFRYLQLLILGLLPVNQSLYHEIRGSEIEFHSSLSHSVLFIALLAVLFANVYVLYENICNMAASYSSCHTINSRVRVRVYVYARAYEFIIYDIPRKVVN